MQTSSVGGSEKPSVYLGATTPLEGSAIQKLALNVDGTLFASVWNYEEDYNLNAPETYSAWPQI